MLTDAELAEIQGRVDAASPAPWHVARGWDGEPYAAVRANGGLDTSLASMLTPGVTPGGGYREPEERPLKNAEFIAHARDDVPALLAEVRSLRLTAAKVREYAEDRAAYGRRGRTVGSARIASDLFALLGVTE